MGHISSSGLVVLWHTAFDGSSAANVFSLYAVLCPALAEVVTRWVPLWTEQSLSVAVYNVRFTMTDWLYEEKSNGLEI